MMKRITFFTILLFVLFQLSNVTLHAQVPQHDSLLVRVYKCLDDSRYDEAERIISETYKSKQQLTTIQEYYLLCFEAEVMYYNALFGIGTQSTLEALRIAETLNNDTLIGNCYNFLGLFAMNESNIHEAIKHLQKAVKYIPALHRNDFIAYQYQAYSNLAECFLKINQPDSTLYYTDKSQIEALLLNRIRGMALNKLNNGDAYILKNQFKEAQKEYEEGLNIIKNTKHADVLQFLYTALMMCYNKQGNQKLSLEYLNRAQETDKNDSVNEYSRINFYQQAVSLQQQNKNYQAAFYLQTRLNEIKQQNEKLEIEQRNKILERFYEKSKQLALANLDSELKETELRNKNQITYFLLALLGVGILFTLSLYFLYRQRSKLQEVEHRVALERLTHQKELEQQKMKNDVILEERNRIAKELHDDLGSLSSSIHIMSGLIEKNLSQDSRELEIAQKIKRNSAQLSETLSDLVWAVYSKNDSFDNLIERLKNYAYEMLHYQDIQIQFKHDYNLTGIHIGIVLRKNIFLLFKEAINNVAKYSKATSVNIDMKLNNKELLMTIIDNGVGFEMDANRSGNGMLNMKSRANAINGSLIVKSGLNQGTSIQLNCLI